MRHNDSSRAQLDNIRAKAILDLSKVDYKTLESLFATTIDPSALIVPCVNYKPTRLRHELHIDREAITLGLFGNVWVRVISLNGPYLFPVRGAASSAFIIELAVDPAETAGLIVIKLFGGYYEVKPLSSCIGLIKWDFWFQDRSDALKCHRWQIYLPKAAQNKKAISELLRLTKGGFPMLLILTKINK